MLERRTPARLRTKHQRVPQLRVRAEESELRAGLWKPLQRKDFHPVHDRGQVVTDVRSRLRLRKGSPP